MVRLAVVETFFSLSSQLAVPSLPGPRAVVLTAASAFVLPSALGDPNGNRVGTRMDVLGSDYHDTRGCGWAKGAAWGVLFLQMGTGCSERF